MNKDIQAYNDAQAEDGKPICEVLAHEIHSALPDAENKIWHGAPVWFDDGNPIVGYSVSQNKKQGQYVRLMFWSGADFSHPGLEPGTGKFKDAHIDLKSISDIDSEKLAKWLAESKTIQWDYKNIVKRKGVLERLS